MRWLNNEANVAMYVTSDSDYEQMSGLEVNILLLL